MLVRVTLWVSRVRSSSRRLLNAILGLVPKELPSIVPGQPKVVLLAPARLGCLTNPPIYIYVVSGPVVNRHTRGPNMPPPPPLPPMPPPPEPPPPPPGEGASPKVAATAISLKPGGKSGMTGFKMGSAKKMKTGLGAKPGIFGSATTDEPESSTAAPASATAMPRRALSSGLPGPSDSLASGTGITAAMVAAQAAAIAQAQMAVQHANLGGLAAGATAQQMNVQAAVQAAVKQAAALLSAGGISVPGGGLRMNAVGRIDQESLGTQAPGAAASSSVPESPEHEGEAGALRGPPRRGDYTFCRKYTRSRVRQVPECEPLRSIDVYENLGMVGKGAFNKIYKAKHRESGEVPPPQTRTWPPANGGPCPSPSPCPNARPSPSPSPSPSPNLNPSPSLSLSSSPNPSPSPSLSPSPSPNSDPSPSFSSSPRAQARARALARALVLALRPLPRGSPDRGAQVDAAGDGGLERRHPAGDDPRDEHHDEYPPPQHRAGQGGRGRRRRAQHVDSSRVGALQPATSLPPGASTAGSRGCFALWRSGRAAQCPNGKPRHGHALQPQLRMLRPCIPGPLHTVRERARCTYQARCTW